MLKSGDLGPTGLVVGQSGWEAQNRENPTRSGDITCMQVVRDKELRILGVTDLNYE